MIIMEVVRGDSEPNSTASRAEQKTHLIRITRILSLIHQLGRPQKRLLHLLR
jgi:hypothetical protein